MNNFKINKNDLFNKIFDPNFNQLVIIGNNGVGKTTLTKEIIDKLSSKGIKSYSIKADLNIDKEVKNAKDNNLQKLGLLLNELTNFVYKIDEANLFKYFKDNQSFKEFREKSESNLNKVQQWMNNKIIDNQLQLDENDSDLKTISINMPKTISDDKFELNYNKKINMGGLFKSIPEDAGTGQYFYTILKLINEILKFCSESKDDFLYLVVDEPENLCHPELIIKIANSLKSINNKIIKIICVSHSNIFVSNFIKNPSEIVLMEDSNIFWQYNEDLFLQETRFIFDEIKKIFNIFNGSKKMKSYPADLNKLKDIYSKGLNNWFPYWSIKNEFITSLFYKKIIICEGPNDEYFLNSLRLRTDIFVLKSFGKFEMIFLSFLLKLFGKKYLYTLYDRDFNTEQDDEKSKFWKSVNSLLRVNDMNSFAMKPNLESFLGLNKEFKTFLPRMNSFSETENFKRTDIKTKIETFFNERTNPNNLQINKIENKFISENN